MKLINEKGKLFGLINIVDLLVLLALLAAVGGLAWKFAAPKLIAGGDVKGTLTYTVRVRGVNGRMEQEIKRDVDRDNRLIAGTDYVLPYAYVTNIAVEPFVQQVTTADGRLVNATDPTRVDVIFTVEAKVSKNTAIIKVGPQEIRVGTGHYLKTKYVEYSSTIETVTLDG